MRELAVQDWVPATKYRRFGTCLTVNMSFYQFTFRLRTSRGVDALWRRMGQVFEISPVLNAFRGCGKIYPLPHLRSAGRFVDLEQCTHLARGHHLPKRCLMALESSEPIHWEPIEIVEHTGIRLVFVETNTMIMREVFHHDPHALSRAVAYAPRYTMLVTGGARPKYLSDTDLPGIPCTTPA